VSISMTFDGAGTFGRAVRVRASFSAIARVCSAESGTAGPTVL
jgi:hypothetical protein